MDGACQLYYSVSFDINVTYGNGLLNFSAIWLFSLIIDKQAAPLILDYFSISIAIAIHYPSATVFPL